MRVPKGWVPVTAKAIMEDLLKKEMIKLNVSREQGTAVFQELMFEELMAEDRLNAEVRELLKQYDSEIEKGRLDYRRLFEMTRKKLIQDRNIVL